MEDSKRTESVAVSYSDNELETQGDKSPEKKKGILDRYKYKPSVYFILSIEFCERFGYYALTAILTVYFTSQLHFSASKAVIVYHSFSMLGYFTPIIGAIVSDNFIGRYKTILSFTIIYVFGTVLLAVCTIPVIQEKLAPAGPLFGMVLIMLGMGGIKPCVSTFGADQFKPSEDHKITSYFSVFYISINIGATLSFIVSPLLRSEVSCFGGDCYFLAFGLPALLMISVLILFVSGSKYYVHKPNEPNAIFDVLKVTFFATYERLKNIKVKSKKNFFEWAEGHASAIAINDTKCLYRILLIFITIPVFWALFNQRGSLWTLQAIRMNGNIGSSAYMIPDQMQVINPLLCIILIPAMDSIYGLLEKKKIKIYPLRKMFAGMILSASAFIVSGVMEIAIRNSIGTTINLDQGYAGLNILNGLDTELLTKSSDGLFADNLLLQNYEYSSFIPVLAETYGTIETIKPNTNGTSYLRAFDNETFQSGKKYTMVIHEYQGLLSSNIHEFEENIDSSGAQVRLILLAGPNYQGLNTVLLKVNNQENIQKLGEATKFYNVPYGSSDAVIDRVNFVPMRYDPGGVYTVVVTLNGPRDITVQAYTDVAPSYLNMLLQLPQYILITVGELLLSVTGLNFAYDQSPKRIKVAVTGAWLITSALGNLIVIIVEAIFGESQGSTVQFVFCGMMFLVSIVFAVIAYYYKPYEELKMNYSVDDDKVVKEDVKSEHDSS